MRTRIAVLLTLGFAGAWVAAFGLILATARLPDASGGRVLAIFASADAAGRIVEAGGIPLESFGGVAWTAYARADGFAGRLRQRGALLVILPLSELTFAGICGAGMELFAARRPG